MLLAIYDTLKDHHPEQEFSNDEYRYPKGDIAIEELCRIHKAEFAKAGKSAVRISPGPASHTTVNER